LQIGELAKRSGINASRIRFYEAQKLIGVGRRANGYRTYSADSLVALNIIVSAQSAGFTLKEIRRLLPGGSPRWRDRTAVAVLRKKVRDLSAMEERLAKARARLETLIEDIEDRPEGMNCEANADRILKRFTSRRHTTSV
jgi:DNA-binding transcriptional MerR regulator